MSEQKETILEGFAIAARHFMHNFNVMLEGLDKKNMEIAALTKRVSELEELVRTLHATNLKLREQEAAR